jgi:hypothetical protein
VILSLSLETSEAQESAMTDDTRTVDKAHVEVIREEPRCRVTKPSSSRKPEWKPRYPGSGRLKSKVAIRALVLRLGGSV